MEFEGLPERPHATVGDYVGRTWESLYPYLFGVLAFVAVMTVSQVWPDVLAGLGRSCVKLLDGAIGFSSIMAGFTSTLLGLLFSVRDSRKIRLLERSGHFVILKSYLTQAIYVNILLCVVSIAANVVIPAHPEHIRLVAMAVSALFMCSIFLVLRVARLMSKLL